MSTVTTNNIEAEESDYLYIKTSQLKDSGTGLYTAVPIYKEEIIAVFKGELLTEVEAKKRADEGNDAYFIVQLDGSILDSKNIACFAKYANDASGFMPSDFKNNATLTLDEHNNVCLIAKRNIKAGEEVFCSYGKPYWKKHGNSIK